MFFVIGVCNGWLAGAVLLASVSDPCTSPQLSKASLSVVRFCVGVSRVACRSCPPRRVSAPCTSPQLSKASFGPVRSGWLVGAVLLATPGAPVVNSIRKVPTLACPLWIRRSPWASNLAPEPSRSHLRRYQSIDLGVAHPPPSLSRFRLIIGESRLHGRSCNRTMSPEPAAVTCDARSINNGG